MNRIELEHYMKGFASSLAGGRVVGCEMIEIGPHVYPSLKVETTDGKVILVIVQRMDGDLRPGYLAAWANELKDGNVICGGCVEEEFGVFPAIEIEGPDGVGLLLKS